jgi:hypothetical protein
MGSNSYTTVILNARWVIPVDKDSRRLAEVGEVLEYTGDSDSNRGMEQFFV